MRDQRINPFPGDVVRKGDQVRSVVRLVGTNDLRYYKYGPDGERISGERAMFVCNWIKWCKGSEVVVGHPDSRAGELIPTDGA